MRWAANEGCAGRAAARAGIKHAPPWCAIRLREQLVSGTAAAILFAYSFGLSAVRRWTSARAMERMSQIPSSAAPRKKSMAIPG